MAEIVLVSLSFFFSSTYHDEKRITQVAPLCRRRVLRLAGVAEKKLLHPPKGEKEMGPRVTGHFATICRAFNDLAKVSLATVNARKILCVCACTEQIYSLDFTYGKIDWRAGFAVANWCA